ncbi:MAG: RNA polymerase sigma factor [Planctomycetaceae bacterium]
MASFLSADVYRPDEVHFPARVKHCAARLAQNDPAALAELFDLTAVRAVRFANTITRNTHDAEDALQAAFVRMALYPRVLAHAGHAWAYILSIVRNEALKIMQRKRADRVVAEVAHIWSRETPEDSDASQFVRQALHKLPATQAEVVVLKIWEGLTFAEIGDVLGESPNTAASRYRYALEKLTKYLQPLANPVGAFADAKPVAAS